MAKRECFGHNWVTDPDECSICGYTRKKPGHLTDRHGVVHVAAWIDAHFSLCLRNCSYPERNGAFVKTRRSVITCLRCIGTPR